jgi:transposase
VRIRIILFAADGLQNQQIAAELGVSTRMVAMWRGRLLLLGIQGLLKDAPRPGRTPRITAEAIAEVVAKTTQTTPSNATQWSTRVMAREAGISEASVRRIWHAHGLKPHRIESFKISRDPEFAAKLDDVVGHRAELERFTAACRSNGDFANMIHTVFDYMMPAGQDNEEDQQQSLRALLDKYGFDRLQHE